MFALSDAAHWYYEIRTPQHIGRCICTLLKQREHHVQHLYGICTAGRPLLEKIKQSEDEEIILSAITTSGEKMRALIDEVFGEGTSNNVFGGINCLSFAGGQPVALNFLDAITPIIQADIEKEQKASDKRIKKYTETAKKFK